MKENISKVNPEFQREASHVILAGDVGGTKTLLGLFDPRPVRPRPATILTFATLEHADLGSMVRALVNNHRPPGPQIEAACFGVAGPVFGDTAELTNIPWHIDGRVLATTFGIPRVRLLNDLEAMAYSVPVLEESELHVLQRGEAIRSGNMALIAAGTGLGEALLHHVGGRFIPSPSEGGHADFAPRTEREVEVMRDVTSRAGRAEVESVVSGPGLVNLHRVTHIDRSCLALDNELDTEAPANIAAAALERRCGGCIEALDMFVDAYGAEAGNLALRTVATGGVFVGGGIAPKILPALADGRFMRSFRDKAPLGDMLAGIPVKVILNRQAGLIGAAVFAAGLLDNR